MATARRLDRRTKRALAALVLIILVMVGLAVRSAIVAISPEPLISAPASENGDEIIQLGRHTLLIKQGSVGSKIAKWIHAGSKGARAFEVPDDLFQPNSDALTSEGESSVRVFSNMMNHVEALKAQILVSTLAGNARLEQLRAERLRATLIKGGVPPSRIDVSPEPIKGGAALSQQPELVVVLSS